MVYVNDRRAILTGYSMAGFDATGQPLTNRPTFITYSFQTSLDGLNVSGGTYTEAFRNSFKPLTDQQQRNAREAFAEWDRWSGITFLEAPSGQGDIKLASFDFDLGGPYNSSQAAAYAGGDILFVSKTQIGSVQLYLHEIGHNLGFKHSFDGEFTLAQENDNYASTVMSYTSGGLSGSTLGTLDKDAVSYLYGGVGTDGTQVAGWNWDAARYVLTQVGFETAERIRGTGVRDVIDGRGGADTIDGLGGDDLIAGGDGNDVLDGGAGADRLEGGTGDDNLRDFFGNNELFGGDGNDQLQGGSGIDLLDGGEGTDTLFGGSGDRLIGGGGDDRLFVTLSSSDRFMADAGVGNDSLTIHIGTLVTTSFSLPSLAAAGLGVTSVEQLTIDARGTRGFSIVASGGRDTVSAGDGADTIVLGDGDDALFASGGADQATGGLGSDYLGGGDGDDVLNGEAGDDRIFGDNGADDLLGGDGADQLNGGSGNDRLRGEAGNDSLTGGGGADRMEGGDGDDSFNASFDAALGAIDGGTGNDYATIVFIGTSGIRAGTASYLANVERAFVTGSFGADVLTVDTAFTSMTLDGGGGSDELRIGAASGSVRGGEGDDLVVAGSAMTFLYGGGGADRFRFESATSSTGAMMDQIEDFQTGIDTIDLLAFAPTNVRLQSFSSGSYIYATGAGGQAFQLFVRQSVVLSDLLYESVTRSGTDGADALSGTRGPDSLFGLGGDDVLAGGLGADNLAGGAGADVFSGTRAELAGDIVTDLGVGDRIRITDVAPRELTWSRIGGSLTLGGISLTLSSRANIALEVRAAPGGGSELVAVGHDPHANDFTGDGHGDLLWRNLNTGAFSTWGVTGNGGANSFSPNLTYDGSVATNWKLTGTLDFNGDGVSDLLWREAGGSTTIWTGRGDGGFAPNAYGTFVTPDWKIAATGDFNGDGRDDLIWRNDNGVFTQWQSTGGGYTQNVYSDAGVPTDWKLAGATDFDGDGRDDLVWRNGTGGALSIWTSTGDAFAYDAYTNATVDTSWQIQALADFDGDGRGDILWRNTNGVFTVWEATDGGYRANAFYDATVSNDWKIIQATDFNADGQADLMFRNVNTGHVTIWQTSDDHNFLPNVAYDASVSSEWALIGANGMAPLV